MSRSTSDGETPKPGFLFAEIRVVAEATITRDGRIVPAEEDEQ